MIAPVKKSVNHLRILPSMRITGKPKHVLAAIFCSGFTFDLITLYSLLAIFNDSSNTIRTKGMKDQLCAIYREASERKSEMFLNCSDRVRVVHLNLNCTLNKLFCLFFFSVLTYCLVRELHLLSDFPVLCRVRRLPFE